MKFVRECAVMTALVALAGAAPAAAQVCWGSPAEAGRFDVAGMVTSQDGQTGYLGEVTVNLPGPLALAGEVGTVDLDEAVDNALVFGGRAGFELEASGFSICPTAGIGYTTFDRLHDGVELGATELEIPVVLALGRRLDAGELRFIPFAEAGMVYIDPPSVLADRGSSVVPEDETFTEFLGGAGVTLEMGRFFGRASFRTTSLEGAEPLFRFGVGIGF